MSSSIILLHQELFVLQPLLGFLMVDSPPHDPVELLLLDTITRDFVLLEHPRHVLAEGELGIFVLRCRILVTKFITPPLVNVATTHPPVIHVVVLERVVVDEVHEPLETRRQTGVSHFDVRLCLRSVVDPVHLRDITFCTSAPSFPLSQAYYLQTES
jgi:hypothetical protein